MRLLVALLAFAMAACNVVSISDEPLNREECGKLLDKIHEVYGRGLRGEDLAEYNAARDRDYDVGECLEDPAWGRRGYECAMKATGKTTLEACIYVDD